MLQSPSNPWHDGLPRFWILDYGLSPATAPVVDPQSKIQNQKSKIRPALLPIVSALGLDHKSIDDFVAGLRPKNRFIFESKTALARRQEASFGRILRIISRVCCHRRYYGETKKPVAK
jgi:hypothetical protein